MTHPSFGSHILQISHILLGGENRLHLGKICLAVCLTRLAAGNHTGRVGLKALAAHLLLLVATALISLRRSWASDSSFDFWSAVRLILKGIHSLGTRSGTVSGGADAGGGSGAAGSCGAFSLAKEVKEVRAIAAIAREMICFFMLLLIVLRNLLLLCLIILLFVLVLSRLFDRNSSHKFKPMLLFN